MLSILFWVTVGAFIGWSIPQPAIAKMVQQKITDFIRANFKDIKK